MSATAAEQRAMARALEAAARGPRGVNPQVGAIILSPDGTVLAEGWHRGAGTPHAEVDALSRLAPGAARGAAVGNDAAGPVGGIVGGAVGAATGTVGGILGVDMAPRFRTYVRERNVRSYDYDGRVAVGSVLPGSGVTYYDVPDEYRVQPGYRYTVVNDRPVLVDGRHRIIEVIE